MSRRTAIRGWLVSDAISITGTRVSMIALPWFVLTTTGSATQTGLVALAEMLPLVLLKVLGGPLIDAIGPRRVSIGCDLGSVVAVGAIPALHLVGGLDFPVFLGLVAVAGALRGPGDSAKNALVPSLAAHAEVSLERVTGLSSTVERSASMLGAAVGGGLIALIGPADALVVDAASFALSAVVLGWSTRAMPAHRIDHGTDHGEDPAPYLRQLRDGWDFLRRDPVLLAIAVMVALANLVDLAWASLMVPVWAREGAYGAAAIGLVFAFWGGGSAVGSAMAAAWGERLPRYRTYVVAYALTGLPRFVVFAFAPLWGVLAMCVVGGFFSGFLNPILGAVKYERIPTRLVGRVSSLMTAMCFALMPLGGLLGAGMVAGLGLTGALLAAGAVYFVVTMAPTVVPGFRGMDRAPRAVEEVGRLSGTKQPA